MKKNEIPLLGLALIFCMIASNCPAQGVPVSAPKADSNINQQEQVKTIFSFKSELGLTDDQETKLKALLYDEQSLLATDNSALKGLGEELNGMIEKKDDMQLIKSKLEEMAKIQVDVSYRNIDDSRKVEMILTPAQLDKWKDIQKSFSTQAKV